MGSDLTVKVYEGVYTLTPSQFEPLTYIYIYIYMVDKLKIVVNYNVCCQIASSMYICTTYVMYSLSGPNS
jgi:hypothetical protein